MLPITGCAVLLVLNPVGPVHTVFTVTGMSTAGLNSTVQVRVILEYLYSWMGLTGSLFKHTENGGIAEKYEEYKN